MKLVVQGIEEIELTDPQGLCNPPVPQLPSPSQPWKGNPIPTGIYHPTPQIPPAPQIPPGAGGWGDPTMPRAGDVAVPHRPSIYTRHHDPNDSDDPFAPKTKWGVGGEAIQRAGEQVDPDKFEKNWQAGIKRADGNRNTH